MCVGVVAKMRVSTCSQPSLHNKAVDTIKALLSWHDSDPRYVSPEARHRVAALYFPLLSVVMDVLPLLHMFSQDKNDRYSGEDHGPSNINPNVAMAIAGKLPTSTCDSFQAVSFPRFVSFHIQIGYILSNNCRIVSWE